MPIIDAGTGTSTVPSTSSINFNTNSSVAERLLGAINLSKWFEVIIPSASTQVKHEEFVPVFRALLTLNEKNQQILFDAIARHNAIWSEIARLFGDKQFEVLQLPNRFPHANSGDFVTKQLIEWLERSAQLRQTIHIEEFRPTIFTITKLMRREKWTELLIDIHSAMQMCPNEILSELLALPTDRNVPSELNLFEALNISALEAKWSEHIQMGQNLRSSIEWNAILDELMPRELSDRVKMPFVLCQTLDPKSALWITSERIQQTQPIHQNEVFASIRAFLGVMLKTGASLYDAWRISKASLYTISVLNNFVAIMRQDVQLQITMDELLSACNCSALGFIAPKFRFRGWLLRVFFENVPATIRNTVLNVLDRDSQAARIFREVFTRHTAPLTIINWRQIHGTSPQQQQLIEHIARLLIKFDSFDRFRQNLTPIERARLLEQILLNGQTTVEFLDRLGASTSMRVLRLFANLLHFRQQQHVSSPAGHASLSLDFDEALNLVESFDKTRLSQPYSGIANFLSDAWAFGCSSGRSWRNSEPNLVSILFHRHNDLFERRKVNFFVEMSARSRMEFLFWFAAYADDFLRATLEQILNARISARQLEPFLVDNCFSPEMLGRRKFREFITTLERLGALQQLNVDKWVKQLLILLIEIPVETEREPWFSLLESASASQIEKALSGNYLDRALKLWHCFYGHIFRQHVKKRKVELRDKGHGPILEAIYERVFTTVRNIIFIHLSALKVVATIFAATSAAASSSSAPHISVGSSELIDDLSTKFFTVLIHFCASDVEVLLREFERAKLTPKQLEDVLLLLTRNNEFASVLHQSSSELDIILAMEDAVQKLCDWKGGEHGSMDQFEELISEVDSELFGISLGQEDCSDNEHANFQAFLLKVFAEFRTLRERSLEPEAVNRAQSQAEPFTLTNAISLLQIEHRETNEQMKMMIDDVVDKVFNAIGFAALCPSSNQIRAVAEKRIKVILCQKVVLEIKRKNLSEEGSWGNLLERLKVAQTSPAMREEIGKAQKMSLGFDFEFYEQQCLQFILDEWNDIKTITNAEERARQRSFVVHGLPLGDQQQQQHNNEASSSNYAPAESTQNRWKCDNEVKPQIEKLLSLLGVRTSPQQCLRQPFSSGVYVTLPEAADQRQILSAFKQRKANPNFQFPWPGIQLMPALSKEEQTQWRLLHAELLKFRAMYPAAANFQISGAQILDQQGKPVYINNNQLHRCPWPRILNLLESVAFDATPRVAVSNPGKEFITLPTPQQTFRVVRSLTTFAYLGNWRLKVREDDCPVCLEPIGVEESGDRGHVELPECQHRFHKGCLRPWLVNNETCPSCRKVLEDLSIYQLLMP